MDEYYRRVWSDSFSMNPEHILQITKHLKEALGLYH